MNTIIEQLQKDIESMGLELNAPTPECILDIFRNTTIRLLFVREVRRQLEIEQWVKKYGACKDLAIEYSVQTVSMTNKKFLVIHGDGGVSH